jgi:hypothetical protein
MALRTGTDEGAISFLRIIAPGGRISTPLSVRSSNLVARLVTNPTVCTTKVFAAVTHYGSQNSSQLVEVFLHGRRIERIPTTSEVVSATATGGRWWLVSAPGLFYPRGGAAVLHEPADPADVRVPRRPASLIGARRRDGGADGRGAGDPRGGTDG